MTSSNQTGMTIARENIGDWEGDLIKGANNASAIGTLVDRKSRYLILVHLDNSTAEEIYKKFSAALNNLPAHLRRTLTYDRGSEMAKHQDIAEQTGVRIYFCDPRSPWQRPTNENTNGLIRQYLPKGTDLSDCSPEDLDKICASLNGRPRASLGFKTPFQVFSTDSQTTPKSVTLQN